MLKTDSAAHDDCVPPGGVIPRMAGGDRRRFRGARVAALVAVLGGLLLPQLAAADGPHGRHDGRHYDHPRGYVLDRRYNHNHYYPPRGYAVRTLPRGYVTVRYGRTPYYYNRGVWYRPGGAGFVVVRPAVGLYVPVLPPFYTTLWARGVPYYYADDTYYRWAANRREYVVTEAPRDTDVQAAGSASAQGDLFIYPKNGQGEEQQSRDRYECHSWAADQSGFDPTQPLGGVAESEATARRADYQRAQTACLEARGYSVK